MDFSFTDEQNEVRELARKILGDLASNERLKDIESRQPVFDEELWRELGRSNLLGLAVDDAHAGSGFGWFELCILLQEIGRSVAPVPVYASLVLGALPLSAFGSSAQKETWLPKLASGDAIFTGALAELGSADVTEVETTAEPSGDAFRLHGEKTLVPAAQLADRIVVPARLGDRVVFAGFRHDLDRIVPAFTVFCLSSHLEGLGTSLLDAMAFGRPVVATAAGGIPEAVEDGVTGRIVPPREPAALAEALESVLRDDELRRGFGDAGRRRFLQHFTADRMVEGTLRVVSELA